MSVRESNIDNDIIAQKVIDKMFEDNPNLFVDHHLSSYNDFFHKGLKRIMREKNPIRIMKMQDPITKEFKLRCNLYLGGKSGEKVYYGKPVIYDDDNPHFMYPNEARLRNMTYAMTVHYDVDVEYFIEGEPHEKVSEEVEKTAIEAGIILPTRTITLEKIYMGRFPVMLMSDLCILNGLDPSVRFQMGECKNDYGGYFIIDGKEKCIISQEKFADNMLYVRENINEIYGAAADIRSASEDTSKPVRTLSVRKVLPSSTYTNGQIVVNIPNVRKPIPLFILMRALGVISDKEIIECCLLDLVKNASFIDMFIPSVHDANRFFTQEESIKFIATFIKVKTIPSTLEILTDFLLPHVGEMNFKEKAYFIGNMVFELLKVDTGLKKGTDRDSFRYKRVELPGILLSDLFKEYYTLQVKDIFKKIDKEYYYKEGIYQGNFYNLIELNTVDFFADRLVDNGIKRGFKGNWGAEAHTKRLGAVQDLNRLSYNSALAQLRKVNLSIDASAKITGPLLLHSSQWGMIDPVDTPDGGNVGLHKNLSMGAHITSECSRVPMLHWLRKNANLRLLSESSYLYISTVTKVFVNGYLAGTVGEPIKVTTLIKEYRRSGLLPAYISVYWNIKDNSIFIYTDSGRLCRPIYYIEDGKASYERDDIFKKIMEKDFSWSELLSGFSKKKQENESINVCNVYSEIDKLYSVKTLDSLKKSQAVLEYIDNAEEEGALIALHSSKITEKPYTHLEIHPSLILGIMGNQVVFPENNQLPRDLFACGQMKQAVSLYHSNYQVRIDKMGVVLNNGQIPLIKSRYLEKINKEQHPYGENVIVAIMCYGGYNVEDAILFNKGSLDRGIFRTTYYTMYESREESSTISNTTIDSTFANVEDRDAVNLKPGFDYGELDDSGLIRENTYLDDKKVIIGKVVSDSSDPDRVTDASVFPKKGQLGFVDKTFMTDSEEGFRIAKVRVRNERIPSIGDKFCSRCGQKGTIGLVVPEENMPFTEDGIRPDIIVNPHALPSRMTIGQLVETVMGKACCIYGGFGDCTAFMNKGSKHKEFGEMLKSQGFHSSGNQVLYNGESGEQIQSNIFTGPTYYMRLKHMVKDKINYRARGPRTVLTRQTVQGRANDGGLRVGEMERDGIVGHGAAKFLQESMLVRGDEYYMAVCNLTGMVAVYNESYNIFLSPQVDGPLRYVDDLEGNLQIENISKFGRTFSIVRVPYAFKLLMQELQTMNIQMRIITDKNIDQLSNMTNSDNIIKLLGKDIETRKLLSEARKSRTNEQPEIMKQTPESRSESVKKSSSTPDALPQDIGGEDEKKEQHFRKTPSSGAEVDEKKLDPEHFGWYRISSKLWGSLILNREGRETDSWNVEKYDRLPDEYPKGWKTSEAIYDNSNIIPPGLIVRELKRNVVPNNWNIAIENLRKQGEQLSSISTQQSQAPPIYIVNSPMPVPNVSKEIGDIIDTSKEKTIEKTIVDGNDEGSSALNEAADEKKDDIIDAVEKAKGLLEIKKGGSILFQSEVKNEKNNSNEDCSMNSSNKKVKLN
jgi:DNA-directed RNA polymerase II subunit RPB2